jgi:hypothetical protein
MAVGLTVQGVSATDPVLIRSPRAAGGVPTPWSPSEFAAASQVHPDYSMSALTGHWVPQPSTNVPIFGGISTGGEVMPTVNSSGELQMTSGNWYMLGITVGSLALGRPGSVLAIQSASGRDPSGDIVSYYASGSGAINAAFVDTSRLENSREQLELQEIDPAPTGPRSITNFDYGMGVISIDPLNKAGSMFPVRDCYYFTLTKAFVLANSTLVLDGQAADEATVYVMTWNATAVPPWSAPSRAFDRDTLFPGVAAHAIEIDALSVDRGTGTALQPQRVVLSLTLESNVAPGGPWDQILVHQRGTCATQALGTDPAFQPSGTFSDKIGLYTLAHPSPAGQPDNVTGTCGGDPIEPYLVGPVVGIATNQNRAGLGQLGLTGLRTYPSDADYDSDDMTATLHLQVAGMDYANFQLGFITLYLEGPPVGTGQTPATPVQWGQPIWIDPTISQRNTMDIAVPVPIKLQNEVFRVSAVCTGVNLSPTFLSVPLRESWVLSIGM